MYFEKPTQVMFYDPDSTDRDVPPYSAGIAYGDKIICACCGGVFSIEEIEETAKFDDKEPLIILPWIDFHEDIEDLDCFDNDN